PRDVAPDACSTGAEKSAASHQSATTVAALSTLMTASCTLSRATTLAFSLVSSSFSPAFSCSIFSPAIELDASATMVEGVRWLLLSTNSAPSIWDGFIDIFPSLSERSQGKRYQLKLGASTKIGTTISSFDRSYLRLRRLSSSRATRIASLVGIVFC